MRRKRRIMEEGGRGKKREKRRRRRRRDEDAYDQRRNTLHTGKPSLSSPLPFLLSPNHSPSYTDPSP